MAFIDQRTRPATDRRAPDRLLAHSLALLLVLVALVPVVGVDAVFSADEGAAIVQARRVADDGSWAAAHPLPEEGIPARLTDLTLVARDKGGIRTVARFAFSR